MSAIARPRLPVGHATSPSGLAARSPSIRPTLLDRPARRGASRSRLRRAFRGGRGVWARGGRRWSGGRAAPGKQLLHRQRHGNHMEARLGVSLPRARCRHPCCAPAVPNRSTDDRSTRTRPDPRPL